MLDIIPKFPELALRMRLKHMAPLGTEVMIIQPQGILSARKCPAHRRKELSDKDLENKRYESPSVALMELVYNTIRLWLNEDPILWCQYGARCVVNKIADTYPVSLYPFPNL